MDRNFQMIDDKIILGNNGFYIEAGANNGIDQSNTKDLEDKGWRGLLIEPNKLMFSECCASRSDKNIFENCALVSFGHIEKTIRGNFAETEQCQTLVSQVTTLLEYWDIHQAEAAREKSHRQVIEVPAKTLQSLIDYHKIEKIDYLSLDVEGYEYEAMEGLDFTKNPPTYIRVETSTIQYRIDSMTKYMKSKGYEFKGMASNNDCFYAKVK